MPVGRFLLLIGMLWSLAGCATTPRRESPAKEGGADTTKEKAGSQLTVRAIKVASDSEVEAMFREYVAAKMGDYSRETDVFVELPKGLQMFYATDLLEAEVNNGGFHQYFWNSSGNFARDALDGLKLIGAQAHAKLLQQAMAIRDKEEAHMDAKKAEGTAEAFSESARASALNKLDKEFYKLGDSLTKQRMKYVRAYPEMFVP